ncbi:MAG: 3-oxoadipyl-CoA thiolase [Phycisphaerae bacterium]|nr:3-oxoadipyl-CoA thiolase [Phycisphaerae bacterium]
MTRAAFVCDAVRTPIGRYGGALARIRADDFAAIPLAALVARNPGVDWTALDDVVYGCANQAGEDNRNVARMALLLAGLPAIVTGVTVNRLCGSGLEAVAQAGRMIALGDADLVVAGGVEQMSRAPFVMAKATEAFGRNAEIFDTTLGWRFPNPRMRDRYGVDSMAETAEVVAAEVGVTREDQDRFALASQTKAAAAGANGSLGREIVPVTPPGTGKEAPAPIASDEHPRATTLERLASLAPIVRPGGTVTAGNASGINDGAAALLLASERAVARYGLTPLARIEAVATAGVEPRVMGLGPVPATQKLLARQALSLGDVGVIELNEAFAAQAVACLRRLGVASDDPRVNRLGGAIALGHPLGMSGARIVGSAARQLASGDATRALCTMCIGVGQGIAMTLVRV